MKVMCLFLGLFLVFAADAQTLGERAKATTKQKVGDRMDQTISGGVDSGVNRAGRVLGGLFKKRKKDDPAPAAPVDASTGAAAAPGAAMAPAGQQPANVSAGPAVVTAYGDFVPGATVLMDEHFDKDALGDFPAQWNTNGSGKLVNVGGQNGKWLDIALNSIVNPVLNKPLPENSTVSFDLFLQAQGDQVVPTIQFGLTAVSDLLKEDIAYKDKFFVGIGRYAENDGHTLEYGLRDVVGNKNDFPLVSYAGKVLHIDMAINKTRIRVYADQVKLIDLPRALTPGMRNNFYVASMSMVPAPQLDVLVGNIRIASAETDARSLLVKQLMEEGKATTNDILFDVNSDVIKAASYPVIDALVDGLKANAAVRVQITGHTDSDGTAAHNLDLSQRRAAAVKNYMVSHGIDGSRLQSDGKGMTQPVASNDTEAGKAKNRRVEFVKL
ncbi:MAG TPA: OmpA family protein [Puia sp.]|uniref:OmpA family protein n=1 Tax=Puia sp. TaxID=2045100 RepID=UPI002C2FFB7B|nr:OmpA family protein [Puia sp.]HVU98398.1 OmpA family protein [Puia sp.]